MKTTRTVAVLVGVLVLLSVGAGCGQSRREISERDRKEAAVLASEAQFAIEIRDWARAEGLLTKAVQFAPDADYWVALGSARVRIGNKPGAKAAYEQALRRFEDAAAVDAKRVEPWLGQVTVLALLGKVDQGRAVAARAAKRFPNDARLKELMDPKAFQAMVSDPGFKENAL